MNSSKRKLTASSNSARATDHTIDMDVLPSLIGFNIRRAQIALWRDFHQNVAEGEIRPGVFSALALVNANPGIAQTDLANQLGIDKASMVSLIDRLEDESWVIRQRSTDDRRRQGIFITSEGTKTFKALRKEMLDHERKFVERFTDKERDTLIELLQRLHR
jgi:DNA-binding MarR family transcriptional regulator